jgi:hypothetical protein
MKNKIRLPGAVPRTMRSQSTVWHCREIATARGLLPAGGVSAVILGLTDKLMDCRPNKENGSNRFIGMKTPEICWE